jgi:hypothetical protein
MYLKQELENMRALLSESEALGDCRIIIAYPYAKKPSRLGRVHIALYEGEVSGEAYALGQEEQRLSYQLCASLFVPQNMGSPYTGELAKAVVKAMLSTYPLGIGVSEVKANDELGCYEVRCSFTYEGREE